MSAAEAPRPPPYLALSASPWLAVFLPAPVTCFWQGQLQVGAVLTQGGQIDVMGWTLSAEDTPTTQPSTLSSPRGYSLLKMEISVADVGGAGRLRLDHPLLSDADLAQLRAQHAPGHVCVLLAPAQSSAASPLIRRQTNVLGGDSWSPDLERLLDVNLFRPDASSGKTGFRAYQAGPEWAAAVQRVLPSHRDQSRLLCVGGKGVGKSTFLRYLTNRLLQKIPEIVFIDLDPGQAEFTLPGCVSATVVSSPVLGPNFCNLTRPQTYTFYVGDVNVSNCPSRYLACVGRLFDLCEQDEALSGRPWLINSMGFNRGLGVALLKAIIRKSRPNTLVEIQSRFKAKNFDLDLRAESMMVSDSHYYQLLRFSAIPESPSAQDMQSNDLWGCPEPRKLRDLVLRAYWTDDWQRTARTYRVPFCRLAVSQLQDGSGGDAGERQRVLLQLLNGSMVALSRVEAASIVAEDDNDKNYFARVLGKCVTPCLGFAIVRAVDTRAKCLIISVSQNVSEDALADVNCLLLGEIRLPERLWLQERRKDGEDNSAKTPAPAPYLSDRRSENPIASAWIRSSKPKTIFNQSKAST